MTAAPRRSVRPCSQISPGHDTADDQRQEQQAQNRHACDRIQCRRARLLHRRQLNFKEHRTALPRRRLHADLLHPVVRIGPGPGEACVGRHRRYASPGLWRRIDQGRGRRRRTETAQSTGDVAGGGRPGPDFQPQEPAHGIQLLDDHARLRARQRAEPDEIPRQRFGPMLVVLKGSDGGTMARQDLSATRRGIAVERLDGLLIAAGEFVVS